MISALVQGELVAEPVQRTATNGSQYVTGVLRVPAGADALLVGISTFAEVAAERLMRLHKGSPVAAVGVLEATEWQRDGEQRRGWRLTATEVLSVHQARQRQKAQSL